MDTKRGKKETHNERVRKFLRLATFLAPYVRGEFKILWITFKAQHTEQDS